MGCCLAVIVLAGAPRLALFLWWLLEPARVLAPFASWGHLVSGTPDWIWPILGFFLLPWTTIAYVFVAPGGITTFEWIIIVVALLLDLSTHTGSCRAYRRRYV